MKIGENRRIECFDGKVENMYGLSSLEKAILTKRIENNLMVSLNNDMDEIANSEKLFNLLNDLGLFDKDSKIVVSDGKIVYCTIHLGTNGLENSIKNSLLQVATAMSILQTQRVIVNTTLSDVAIDVLDDVYDFVLMVKLE